jgi:hypothetical protein
MQRLVFEINRDRWDEVPALLARIDAMESSYGMPPSRRYTSLAGTVGRDAIVWEREFESLAALEEIAEGLMADREFQKLAEEAHAEFFESTHYELYVPYEPSQSSRGD